MILSSENASTKLKITQELTPVVNWAWMCDSEDPCVMGAVQNAVKHHQEALAQAFGGWSSKMVRSLNLGTPHAEHFDSEQRKVGLWLVRPKPGSPIVFGIWSDGHGPNPSRGTTYEVFVPEGKESLLPDALRALTEWIVAHTPQAPENRPQP